MSNTISFGDLVLRLIGFAFLGGVLGASSGFFLLIYMEITGQEGGHQAPLIGVILAPVGVVAGSIIGLFVWAVKSFRKAKK